MRVVMLGHSNAGKTTYMSSMYEIGKAGLKGFRIRTKEPTQEPELLRRAGDITRGSYPPPSAQRTSYDFVLSYRFKDFHDFTWSDYRGGALLDRSSDAEAEAVLSDLHSADGIVVFADAQALADGPAGARAMRRLSVLLQGAIASRTTPVPLIVAYTKADLVSEDPRVWERIRTPLAAVMDAAHASDGVLATDVAVACGPSARNVEVPLLWCLGNSLINRVVALESELARSRSDAKRYAAKAGLGDSISSWWNSVPSYAKMAETARKNAERELSELRPLRRPATQLAANLVQYHPAGSETVNAARADARKAAAARRSYNTGEFVKAIPALIALVALFGGMIIFLIMAAR